MYYRLVNGEKTEIPTDEIAAMEEDQAAYEAAERTRPLTVEEVDRRIGSIGTVTAHSGPVIEEAREEYDALTGNQKKYVDRLAVLGALGRCMEVRAFSVGNHRHFAPSTFGLGWYIYFIYITIYLRAFFVKPFELLW